MITIEMSQVQFGITAFWTDQESHDRGDDPVAVQLRVTDPKSGIVMQVPFDGAAWQNFRRHVEKNGEVAAVEIARAIPDGMPSI